MRIALTPTASAPPRQLFIRADPRHADAAEVTQVRHAGRALIADPALTENTALGPLPRVADDDRKPMTAYAGAASAGKFRIAIVVTGLGLSAKATQGRAGRSAAGGDRRPSALRKRCAALAFLGGAFRGHEVVLQVPGTEPFDFPDSDPGPHTAAHRQRHLRQYRTSQLGADPLHRLCRCRKSAGDRSFRFRRAGAGADILVAPEASISADAGSALRSVVLHRRRRPGRAFAQGTTASIPSRQRWKSIAGWRNWKYRPHPWQRRRKPLLCIRSRSNASPWGEKSPIAGLCTGASLSHSESAQVIGAVLWQLFLASLRSFERLATRPRPPKEPRRGGSAPECVARPRLLGQGQLSERASLC